MLHHPKGKCDDNANNTCFVLNRVNDLTNSRLTTTTLTRLVLKGWATHDMIMIMILIIIHTSATHQDIWDQVRILISLAGPVQIRA